MRGGESTTPGNPKSAGGGGLQTDPETVTSVTHAFEK